MYLHTFDGKVLDPELENRLKGKSGGLLTRPDLVTVALPPPITTHTDEGGDQSTTSGKARVCWLVWNCVCKRQLVKSLHCIKYINFRALIVTQLVEESPMTLQGRWEQPGQRQGSVGSTTAVQAIFSSHRLRPSRNDTCLISGYEHRGINKDLF